MTKQQKDMDTCAAKRLSFVLATKNRAEYLRQSLERHRELVTAADELIVVDGLSTDDTASVVSQFSDIVDTFISEPDTNPAHAFNKGMLICRGKYIKLQTDDDIIYPESLEQAINIMEEHPGIDILMCGGIRQRGDMLSAVYIPPGTNYGESTENVFRYGACGVGFIIRRSSLAKIGLMDTTNWVADKELVLRAISQGANVKFCRIKLFHHPIYDHSVTTSRSRQFQDDDNKLRRDYYSPGAYISYRRRKWYSAGFLPWLKRHPGLYGTARALARITGRKSGGGNTPAEAAAPDAGNITWDGGFS